MRAPITQGLTRPWRALLRALCFGFHLSSYAGVRVPGKAAALSPCSILPCGRAHGRRCSYCGHMARGNARFGLEHRLSGLANAAGFRHWIQCAVSRGKSQGIAEYCLGVRMTTGAKTSQLQPKRTLGRDAAYLAKNAPYLVMWEYWWSKISGGGKCACSWLPPKSVVATDWKKFEAGMVAS